MANFKPPKSVPKMRLIKPKAAILITFVKSLASRLIEIIMTIKIRPKMIPVGGMVSNSKYVFNKSPTFEAKRSAPRIPAINAMIEATSTIKPLKKPLTAPKRIRPPMMMSK